MQPTIRRRPVTVALLAGVTLGGLVPAGFTASAAPVAHDWSGVAKCESGGNWSTNTGNGYHGGLQFSAASWSAAGGTQFAPQADQATPAQQQQAAENLLRMQGAGAWPVCGKYLKGGTTDSGGGGASGQSAPAPAPTSAPPGNAPTGNAPTVPQPSGNAPSGTTSGNTSRNSTSAPAQVGNAWDDNAGVTRNNSTGDNSTDTQTNQASPWSQYGQDGWGQSSTGDSSNSNTTTTGQPTRQQPPGVGVGGPYRSSNSSGNAGTSARGAWEGSQQWNDYVDQIMAGGQPAPVAPGEVIYQQAQQQPSASSTGTDGSNGTNGADGTSRSSQTNGTS